MTILLVWVYMFANHLSVEGLIFNIVSIPKKLTNTENSRKFSYSGPPPSHEIWDDLLAQHVDGIGLVRYEGFEHNRIQLQSYLQSLSQHPPNDTWSTNEKMAYWINAYNAFTVELILMHQPVQSIKEIGGDIPMINTTWDIQFFEIEGIPFDLNTIEHLILRKEFDDPRIHFAINCASMSCPKLLDEAYRGDSLNNQLNQQTKEFLLDSDKNYFEDGRFVISPIFKWFSEDFGSVTDIRSFIESQSGLDLGNTKSFTYSVYNWSLNQSR